MSYVNLLLFGDQTVEKLSSIQSLVRHSKTSSAARTFLRQVTDVVQLDFSKLNAQDRGWSHEIHTLLGLAEDNARQKEPNGIMATVLMCIGRLGDLIVYAEEDPSILGSQSSPVHILALCTGLLPAAAAAAARDTSELLKIGIEIVSITFRMAFEISRRMKLIEEEGGGNWATTIVGATVERTREILENFHKAQNIPEPRKLAIGVVAKGWLTLIGPPSSLTRLWAWSSELDQAVKVTTDTNGPIHTTHMPKIDLAIILGDSPSLDYPITSKVKITSNSSRKAYSHPTLRSLLGEMITDIARNVLYLSDTVEECVSDLVGKGNIRLTTVGPTGHLPTVQRALQDRGIIYEMNQHLDPMIGKFRGGTDLVAIVGMAGRFPGSETIGGFWEGLLAGKNHIKKVPKSRFDLDVFYDASGKKKNSTMAQHGSFLDRPGLFDNRLFSISPREAAQMDPIQRLLLTTSYEALEIAGYSPNASLATESNRIATYFGQTSDDWHEVLNNEGIDIYYVPSLVRAFGPSRLNYQYKWGGGSYAVDSACATSTTAISLACSALLARDCDTALAGGGSVLVSPNSYSGLSRSGMISTTGGCRTFHDDADGYARGEGVGVVVLKRLEDAISDNDNILAVIRGSARTYSSTASSITHPDSKSQRRLYEEVLRQTSVDPMDISYVEMHGTGTQAGDAEEMTSVLQTLGQNRTKDNPLVVGAVKANVGHGEAAAGVTSLIKVLMMLRERIIPPQPDLPFKVNHNFPPLEKINVRIAGKGMALRPRPGGDGLIKVLLNSFDASGGNTSLAIEQAPERAPKMEDPRPYHIVTLSARSIGSLRENRKRLLDYLTRHTDTKLADLAYTTTARRMHQDLRVAYPVGSTKEIVRFLRAGIAEETTNGPSTRNTNTPKVFAFTGQGSQYAGMGKELYHQSATFRAVLLAYQDMAESQGLPSFMDLISESQLDLASESVVRVHLAIVALEIAVAQTLRIWGVQPDLVIGHSLGEYAALCVSGVLSVSDTLHLVGQRALLIEANLMAGIFAMLAVRKDVHELRKSLNKNKKLTSCEIACINAPSTTVVSGTLSDITDLQERLEADGTKTTLLKIPYGFHSKQVEPIVKEFEAIAGGVNFLRPIIPVASTLTGTIVQDNLTFSPSYLARQTREPVNFVGALHACRTAGFANARSLWIEVGPEPICSGLVRATLDATADRLLATMKSSENNWKTISSTLATAYESGVPVNWSEYHKDFKDCLTLLDLPTYAFDEKNFWISYATPEPTAHVADPTKQATKPTTPLFVPGFPTTSLQRVEGDTIVGEKVSITFASDTSDPNFFAAIQGHVVNGVVVCPLSVFCDMALSASNYVYSRLKPGKPVPKMSLHNVDLVHPLIVPGINSEQIVKVSASYTSESTAVSISFHSTDGKKSHDHGSCHVVFDDSHEWKTPLSQTLFLMGRRIDSLRDLATAGKGHRLLKPVVYKLFANLVVYGEKYKALEEVLLDNESHDAVATVKLPTVPGSGQFLLNPYWMDATAQLAGFLLNGSLKYPEDIACLSTGFDSWRLFEELSAGKSYTSYVCMQETEKSSLITGDCFVLDGSKLVSVIMGIRFQKMKKVLLSSILLPGAPSSDFKHVGTSHMAQPKSFSASKNVAINSKESAFTRAESSPSSCNSSASLKSDTSLDQNASTPESSADDINADVVAALVSAVAAESGYNLDHMSDDAVFSDMGIDSLMGLTISATLKRDTGVELPGTFFIDNPTLGEAKTALGVGSDAKESDFVDLGNSLVDLTLPKLATLTKPNEAHSSSEDELASTPKDVLISPSSSEIGPSSKIILLQGVDSLEVSKLFLLPDGSGSPASYAQLPSLGADVCVFGVESAFVKEPSRHVGSCDWMADIFVAAIRKKQPNGPYMLGGFSFGALYAYEVSRKLLEAGEQVQGLLIMDMAVPRVVDTSVESRLQQLEEAALIPALNRQTRTQKEHLKSTIRAFLNYEPIPMSPGRRPKKTILVSARSESGSAKISSSKVTQWLHEDFKARGWADLIGEVLCQDIEADHQALLKYPTVKVLGQMCKDAIAKFRA